ncbi:MAG: ParB/RepB/Spo0J family partition protein [Pirellulaceae bacterium]
MLKTLPEHKVEHEFHPAANLFPLLEGKDLDDLAADIEQNGQREPIVLLDGKIIDGRNRYRACEMRGIEPVLVEMCKAPEDLVKYVLSMNLHRRHLTPSQRAMVAARAKDYYVAQAKERKKRKPKSVKETVPEQNNGQSRDQAGEQFGVSGKTVDAASKVISKGSKELAAAVDAGAIPVSRAAKLADFPKSEQSRISKAAMRGDKRATELLRAGDQETIAKVEAGKLAVSKAMGERKTRKRPNRPPSEPCDECRSDTQQVEGRGRESQLCTDCFDTRAASVSAGGAESYHAPEHKPISNAVLEEHVETCSKEPMQISVTRLNPLDTVSVVDLIDALAKRSTPEDFLSCSAKALDRIRQIIATALASRKDVTDPIAADSSKACEAPEEQPATPDPSAAEELFPIEHRDDGWHIMLPSGATEGPFNAKRLARDTADGYRQHADSQVGA